MSTQRLSRLWIFYSWQHNVFPDCGFRDGTSPPRGRVARLRRFCRSAHLLPAVRSVCVAVAFYGPPRAALLCHVTDHGHCDWPGQLAAPTLKWACALGTRACVGIVIEYHA
jgi:hypothetical protein